MASYQWYATDVSSSGVATTNSVLVDVWVGSSPPPNPGDYDLIIIDSAPADGLVSAKEWQNYTGGGLGLNGGSALSLFDGTPKGAGTLYSSEPYQIGDTGLKDGLANQFTVDPLLLQPCFTPGTRIAVPGGEVPVEDLRPGDLVMTLDAGPQPLVWTGQSQLGAKDLDLRPDLRPVRMRRDALGPGQPRRPLRFSPQHRVLWQGHLVAVRHLARESVPGFHQCGQGMTQVTYIHIALAEHHILMAEGAPVESFFTGEQALRALPHLARARLLAALPALCDGSNPMRPARPFLTGGDLRRLLAHSPA